MPRHTITEGRPTRRRVGLTVAEMVIFAMLGGLMYGSKLIMEALPNIHLIGMFTMTLTLVYRRKALYPIYVFVLLQGLIAGFNIWWIPYLYIWTLLWGITMLLPRRMPSAVAAVVYPAVCALHGFLYGTLYAPAQALFFGFGWDETVAWIVAGLPFDLIHGVSNLFAGCLILPLVALIRRLDRHLPRN